MPRPILAHTRAFIIFAVNRSQREMQKSTGTPSQSQDMESSFKDINTRLNGLDHRLDAIQAV